MISNSVSTSDVSLLNFVNTQIKSDFKQDALKFVSIVDENIKKIGLFAIEEAKKAIKKNGEEPCFSTLVANKKFNFLSNSLGFISQRLEQTFKFRFIFQNAEPLYGVSNSLCGDIFRVDYSYDLKICWTPDNSFIYENKNSFQTQNTYKYSAETILANFWKSAQNGEATDVVFNVEGQLLKAHRTILSLRSPVFKSMFEIGMQEKNSGIVQVSDADLEVFKLFLEFVYIGQLPDSQLQEMGTLIQLINLSTRYQIQDLIDFCLTHIDKQLKAINLDVDNFKTIFEWGVLYDLDNCLYVCFNYAETTPEGMALLNSSIDFKNWEKVIDFTQKRSYPKIQAMLLTKSLEVIKQLNSQKMQLS